jgi:hypothetical protein
MNKILTNMTKSVIYTYIKKRNMKYKKKIYFKQQLKIKKFIYFHVTHDVLFTYLPY